MKKYLYLIIALLGTALNASTDFEEIRKATITVCTQMSVLSPSEVSTTLARFGAFARTKAAELNARFGDIDPDTATKARIKTDIDSEIDRLPGLTPGTSTLMKSGISLMFALEQADSEAISDSAMTAGFLALPPAAQARILPFVEQIKAMYADIAQSLEKGDAVIPAQPDRRSFDAAAFLAQPSEATAPAQQAQASRRRFDAAAFLAQSEATAPAPAQQAPSGRKRFDAAAFLADLNKKS